MSAAPTSTCERSVLSKKILILPGDGIGPEIVAEAVKVSTCIARRLRPRRRDRDGPGGRQRLRPDRQPLPEATLELARAADAVLLGAVGGPKWEPLEIAKRPEKGLLGLRSGLGSVRQPAPGDPLPAAGRRLDAEAPRWSPAWIS
jgi:isocitrate/isopropylmalate dehydrogenase